jgi:hypothetical protein
MIRLPHGRSSGWPFKAAIDLPRRHSLELGLPRHVQERRSDTPVEVTEARPVGTPLFPPAAAGSSSARGWTGSNQTLCGPTTGRQAARGTGDIAKRRLISAAHPPSKGPVFGRHPLTNRPPMAIIAPAPGLRGGLAALQVSLL